MKSELRERLIAEAYKYGAEHCWVEQHRGHPKLRIQHSGRTLTYVLSTSGSDWREAENASAALRRLLGVKREITKSRRPRRKTPSRHKPRATLPKLLAPPMESPFDKLAVLRDRLIAANTTVAEPPAASHHRIKLRTPWLGRRPRWQLAS